MICCTGAQQRRFALDKMVGGGLSSKALSAMLFSILPLMSYPYPRTMAACTRAGGGS